VEVWANSQRLLIWETRARPYLEIIRHPVRQVIHRDLVPKLVPELRGGVPRFLHHVADVGWV
jgi:hypothetical protein|tara:strand:- start:3023 stop:3208 length:186 start_codon:yes stop_codon:yes gene_type:complete